MKKTALITILLVIAGCTGDMQVSTDGDVLPLFNGNLKDYLIVVIGEGENDAEETDINCPVTVVSPATSCNPGKIDEFNKACRKPDKDVSWVMSVDNPDLKISGIEYKADNTCEGLKLQTCSWNPGQKYFGCKLKNGSFGADCYDDEKGIQYKVIVENTDTGSTCTLDPIIIIH